jgi:hypothetical protein
MFLGMSVGAWGLILAIAAIVLAYPLGVMANMTTPMILNWIVKWSDISLNRRISKLELLLKKREEECPLVSATEEQLLWGVLCIAKLIIYVFLMTGAAGTGIGAGIFHPAVSELTRLVAFVVGASCLILAYTWQRVMDRLAIYLIDHSPRARKQLIDSISKLKASSAKSVTTY